MKNKVVGFRKDVSLLPLYNEIMLDKKEKIDEPRGELEKKVVVDNKKIKFVKYSDAKHNDQDLIEYLLFILLLRIEIPSMEVELGYEEIGGQNINCCLLTDVVQKELGNEAISLEGIFFSYEERVSYSMTLRESISVIFESFQKLNINENNDKSIYQSYVNMLLCDFLFDNPDRHFDNYFLIYNSVDCSYSFAPLIDNGSAFDSYQDSFFKYHLGFCQYKKDEYIKFLLDEYYYLLEPLINRINEKLTPDYVFAVLNMECFDNIDLDKKQYILNQIDENIQKINSLVKDRTNNTKIV